MVRINAPGILDFATREEAEKAAIERAIQIRDLVYVVIREDADYPYHLDSYPSRLLRRVLCAYPDGGVTTQ